MKNCSGELKKNNANKKLCILWSPSKTAYYFDGVYLTDSICQPEGVLIVSPLKRSWFPIFCQSIAKHIDLMSPAISTRQKQSWKLGRRCIRKDLNNSKTSKFWSPDRMLDHMSDRMSMRGRGENVVKLFFLGSYNSAPKHFDPRLTQLSHFPRFANLFR